MVISAEFTRPQPLPLTMLVIQNFSPIIAIERQTKVNLRTSTEELTDYKHAETEMKDYRDKSKYAANFKSHIQIKTAKKSREIKIQSKISYQRN